jgi:hypothetical protein
MGVFGLVDDVDVMQHGVDSLDTRYADVAFHCQPHRRAQAGFYFHRATSQKVLIHDTLGIGGSSHFLNGLLPEI